MSIKIEGGDGSAENVIKAGASNELLYNDKEVLLKENLGSGLLQPDLARTQEWSLVVTKIDEFDHNEYYSNPFTVPEDGWIVNVVYMAKTSTESFTSITIKIDGYGELGVTPSQIFLGIYSRLDGNANVFIVSNSNCPYPVKKGQVIEADLIYNDTIITFAPCKGL